MIAKTKNIKRTIKKSRVALKYFVNLGLLISSSIVFVTGIIKFPSFLITRELLYSNSELLLILHDFSGIALGLLSFLHIMLHRKWIIGTTKAIFWRLKYKKILKFVIWASLLLGIFIPLFLLSVPESHTGDEIKIQGIGTLKFNVDEVATVRTDLFNPGHFSIFDILVNLDNDNKINMEYHFDGEMDSYIIDSINGIENFWHIAYYDGGWPEGNVFRMDHYPYKPKMYIELYQSSSTKLNKIYNTFREELTRNNNNNGTTIIPEVFIKTPSNQYHFIDVEVTAHNLRNDFFQNGVITAIDVIMSMGDQGLITYDLKWYEEIGFAEIKNYYVESINGERAYGSCGYVYEAGDNDFKGFTGNHIHITADIRIITSPEYEEWFWICL
jgi:hypothetical protein